MQQYNTFWKIIRENEIVIPTIQRDFAYGREEASNILDNLLKSIKQSLDKEDGQLHLAFVYGKLEGKQNDELLIRNSENIKSLLQSVKEYANDLNIIVDFDTARDVVRLSDNVKFIPIDGQQRLTTLFLLHWYLAIKLNKTEMLTAYLTKFQYATRVSSKEFCELICSINNVKLNTEINADFITNQEGYFKQWNNDPTVKNMLIVINQINKVFKNSNEKFDNYWELITNTDQICFDFFDLDNFQLTDELYVKMNSRGKKLTQFENFKAWLYHQKEISAITKKKIDITWYDVFWKAQGSDTNDIDTAYLQWFKNLYLADYLKYLELSNNKGLNDKSSLEENSISTNNDFYNAKATIGILRNGEAKFLDFIVGMNEAKELMLKNIEPYLNKLDAIVSNHKEHLNIYVNKDYYPHTIEKLLFTEQSELNWWQVTFQYAVVEYLSNHPYDDQYLNNFLRIISNLIFNTAIDSPKDYLIAIKSIDKILTELKGDVLYYLQDKDIDEISFFSIAQKKEEKIKAEKIIKYGEEWKQAIIEAEDHKYFYGQIGFILSLHKENEIVSFKKLSLRFRNLFSDYVLQKEDNFLFRGLLTGLGKPLFIKDGNILRYPINDHKTLRTRNENWRRNLLSVEKIEIIANYIQNDEFDLLENAIKYLEDNIYNYLPDETFIFPVIKNKELLKNAKQNCLCDYNKNYDQIYLLNTTSLRGYYRELFVMDWYIENKNRFLNDSSVEIFMKELQYEVDDEPGLNIKIKNSSKEYNIKRNYPAKSFDLYEEVAGKIESHNQIDELIKIIKKDYLEDTFKN